MVTPDRQTDPEASNALKFRMKAATVHVLKWAQRSQEISFKVYGIYGGACEIGQECEY
jgi:hypothetical protein